MLSVEPAFLPLQPLSNSGTPLYCPSRSSTPLPQSCSISWIRASFHPFPLRRIPPSDSRIASKDSYVRREIKPRLDRDQVVIRTLRSNDVERVKRLHSSCLPLSYPSSFYTLLLTNSNSLCLLALSPSSSLLGCASGHLLPYTHSSLSDDPIPLPIIYLTSLAIDPLFRSQGLGSRLILDLLRQLAPRGSERVVLQLHVEEGNVKARELYERIGVKETRRIRGYYKGIQRGGGDAIEMKGEVELH